MQAFIDYVYNDMYGDKEFPEWVNVPIFKEWFSRVIIEEIDRSLLEEAYDTGEDGSILLTLNNDQLQPLLLPLVADNVDTGAGDAYNRMTRKIAYDVTQDALNELAIRTIAIGLNKRRSRLSKMAKHPYFDKHFLRDVKRFM